MFRQVAPLVAWVELSDWCQADADVEFSAGRRHLFNEIPLERGIATIAEQKSGPGRVVGSTRVATVAR